MPRRSAKGKAEGTAAAAAASSTRFTQVRFEVTASTNFGEQLKVMGTSARLGQFNHQKAVALVTTPETYPVWRCLQPVMVPTGVEVAYSYLVLSGGVVEPGERVVRSFVPAGNTFLVRDNLDLGLSFGAEAIDGNTSSSSSNSATDSGGNGGAPPPARTAANTATAAAGGGAAGVAAAAARAAANTAAANATSLAPSIASPSANNPPVSSSVDASDAAAAAAGAAPAALVNSCATVALAVAGRDEVPAAVSTAGPRSLPSPAAHVGSQRGGAVPSQSETDKALPAASVEESTKTATCESFRPALPRSDRERAIKSVGGSTSAPSSPVASRLPMPMDRQSPNTGHQRHPHAQSQHRHSLHGNREKPHLTSSRVGPLPTSSTDMFLGESDDEDFDVGAAIERLSEKLQASKMFVLVKHLPIVVRRVRVRSTQGADFSRQRGNDGRLSPMSDSDDGGDIFGGRDALRGDAGGWEWQVEWQNSELKQQLGSSVTGTGVVRQTQWLGVIAPCNILNEDGSQFISEAQVPGDTSFVGIDGLSQMQITLAASARGCVPLWPTRENWMGFEIYCDQFLAPLLHNVQELADGESSMRWEARNDSKMWLAYKNVNRMFAHKVCALFSPRDIVWVHDFHFLLAPRIVRGLMRKTHRGVDPGIILYLNSPFPTSEIMRSLGHRDKILFGILSSSLLVVSVYNYARHFVNTCQRTLGLKARSLEGGMLALETPDSRSLGISIVAPSPCLQYLEQVAQNINTCASVHDPDHGIADASVSLLEEARQLRASYGGRKVIVGVDRCSRLSGVTLKLLAYEKLLGDCPQLINKVVLVQRCVLPYGNCGTQPGGGRLDSLRSSKEIKELVERITTRFGKSVIDFTEHMVEMEAPHTGTHRPVAPSVLALREKREQLKLWLLADVLLHTPVSEGYSVDVLEFIWTIRFRRDSPPVIIISEFSGVTQSLNGVYEVNPFNVVAVSATIDKVLTASKSERLRRAKSLLESRAFLAETSQLWITRILEGLLVVWQGCDSTDADDVPHVRQVQGSIEENEAGPKAPIGHDAAASVAAACKGDAQMLELEVGDGGLSPSVVVRSKPSTPSIIQDQGPSEFAFGLNNNSKSLSSQLLPVTSSQSIHNVGAEKEMVDLEAYTNSCDAGVETEMTPIESHSVTGGSSFRKALTTDIRASYLRCAQRRLFLLAYGGALVAQEPTEKAIKHDFFGVEGREPKSAMKSTLARLAADPANAVFVVSDMSQQQISSLLRGIPNLGFVVGNGLKVVWPSGWPVPAQYSAVPAKSPKPVRGKPILAASSSSMNASAAQSQHREGLAQSGSPQHQLQWTTMSYDDVKAEWLELRREIVKAMAPFQIVNGSRLVTDNEVKVEWDFSRADPEWGGMQADCLCDLLQRNFATHSNLIRINRIQGRAVEVHLRVLGLRSFVREILMRSFSSGFILATGSTSSDEEMFLGLYDAVSAQSSANTSSFDQPDCELHTITMGKKASQAHLYVDGSQGLLRLLAKLR